ncbi:Ankyrin repeats (3 copies) [Phytophthora infestans]|uniref:Ankyrin repeats (3 copies) n=1 Tax=Phytophthora infestans TaxID=4787 RepID=A0A833T124_PHYIN|nr:Ankyrin repeats (3 copies) [Phytophthora infestans]KAF4136181.1 Ankyrin repeats domain-containing protein [Phytophthora infestans]
MDGAAARGRLSILQWLYDNRTEGCSASAFTGASTNGHSRVLKWLTKLYPDLYDPLQCLTAAAGAGQFAMVKRQRTQVGPHRISQALEAAAAYGHVDVLEALRPWSSFHVGDPFNAAVANGQAAVVRFFVDRGYCDSQRIRNGALKEAAQLGHREIAELLLPHCDCRAASKALYHAAENGHTGVVELLLHTREFGIESMSNAAARNDHCDVAKLLLDHFADYNADCLYESPATVLGGKAIGGVRDGFILTRRRVSQAFNSAVSCRNVEMVRILVRKCPSARIGFTITRQARAGNREMVALLLQECEARHLKATWYSQHVGIPVETAASCGDLEMAKLLVKKCDPASAGRALKIAVANNHTNMLHLFAPMTGVYRKEDPYKVDALVLAATACRQASLEIMVHYSDQSTIEEALLRLSSDGDRSSTRLLLRTYDPASYKHLFIKAAEKGAAELVEIILDQNVMGTCSMRWALMTASSKGYVETVRAMLDKCDFASICCALGAAVIKHELAVIDLLRKRCDLASIGDAIESAKSNGYSDVVQLLSCKRSRRV